MTVVGPNAKDLVFVYGTLKKDGCNHHVMQRAGGVFKAKAVTLPYYDLISLGGYPGMVRCHNAVAKGEYRILGEVFEVESLEPLDMLEGYPDYYDRVKLALILLTKLSPINRGAWAYLIKNAIPSSDSFGVETKKGVKLWNNDLFTA